MPAPMRTLLSREPGRIWPAGLASALLHGAIVGLILVSLLRHKVVLVEPDVSARVELLIGHGGNEPGTAAPPPEEAPKPPQPAPKPEPEPVVPSPPNDVPSVPPPPTPQAPPPETPPPPVPPAPKAPPTIRLGDGFSPPPAATRSKS